MKTNVRDIQEFLTFNTKAATINSFMVQYLILKELIILYQFRQNNTINKMMNERDVKQGDKILK